MSICQNANCTKSHSMAHDLALEKLKGRDLSEVARAVGGELIAEGKIQIDYIGKPCIVDCATGHALPVGYEKQFSVKEEIIFLHYLVTASGRALTGNLITYRELRGCGANAISAANDFSMAAMEKAIGNTPEKIYDAMDKVNGTKANLGDASITVLALPKVPITYVIWEGEDNIIPPAVNLLFDSTASDYLPNEDLAELSTYLAEEIISICTK